MYQKAINFDQVHAVLVIKLRHHGDVLLTSPIYRILKQRFPHLTIDALIYKETYPMLADHDDINQIYCIDKQQKGIKQEVQRVRELKQQNYDLIIHFTESWRGAILCRLLRPRYALVRRYQNRQQSYWLNSFSHHYSSPRGNKRHTVEMHLDALRRIGIHPEKDEKQLVLSLNAQAQKSLFRHYPEYTQQNYIVIHPTSRWLFKCYPAEKMAAVINQLCERYSAQIVITAAPDKKELHYIENMLNGVHHKVINLAGQLSLYELAVLLKNGQYYLGLDSVPMHMAAALQVPTVALFGPSGDIEWGPWQNKSIVISSDQQPCRPSRQDG
jgi:heptosyltransferase-3